MNKKIEIIGIMILLITIGFSGCFEPNNETKFIFEYSVESLNESNEKIEGSEGFIYNEQVFSYKISGKIKTKNEDTISKINLITNFYDNDTFLFSEMIPETEITNTYKTFVIFFTKYNTSEAKKIDVEGDRKIFLTEYDLKYFENVTDVKIEYEFV